MFSNFKTDLKQYNETMIRGQSLIAARWIALVGQTLAILVAYAAGFDFPIVFCFICIVLSGIVNNYATINDHHRSINTSKALIYLSFDVLQLTALLYFTGGLTNPFFIILIAPILVGSSLLPKWQMLMLLSLGIASAIYIGLFHLEMGWPENFLEHKSKLLLSAEALALTITLIFSSYYSWSISEENRNMQKANFAAKTALLKQRQLQALGAQAAAAVHELGSPLGTITIIAKELSHDLGQNKDYAEDIETLISQTERCRKILNHFGKTLKSDPTYMSEPLAIHGMLQNIAEGFLLERPEIRFTTTISDETKQTRIPQKPELSHGLGVYIQNAIQLAKSTVNVTVEINKGLKLTIEDDGPGFPEKILPKLGEPYTSTRMDSGKNMGLGVFIAQTLLEDTGANIFYNNKNSGGAQIIILWSQIAFQSLLINDKK